MAVMDYQDSIVTIASSSEPGSDPFPIDIAALFLRQTKENMYPYLYSTPDANIEGDLARGELHYNELIYNVPEYYLYREEVRLLQTFANQLATHIPKNGTVCEFGVGTEIAFRNKTLPFLKAIPDLSLYAPIDLCVTYLIQARSILAQELPNIGFKGIETDFIKNVAIVREFENLAVFFKGSTITNLNPSGCIDFFSRLSSYLPSGGLLIVGQDSNSDAESLRRAYVNDPLANTMLSVFYRLKRDYSVESFKPSAFSYRFDWLSDAYCVKHTAVATESQRFELNRTPIEIEANEEFHIVSSYKYPVEFFQDMAKQGGFQPLDLISEESNPMAIHVLQKP